MTMDEAIAWLMQQDARIEIDAGHKGSRRMRIYASDRGMEFGVSFSVPLEDSMFRRDGRHQFLFHEAIFRLRQAVENEQQEEGLR